MNTTKEKEKAKEIASRLSIGYSESDNSFEECYHSALEMARWKERQMEKMENYLYRSEECYGSGERDIRKVIAYETNELGNTDIWHYCMARYELSMETKDKINEILNDLHNRSIYERDMKEAIDLLIEDLTRIFGVEPRYCLWLTDFDTCRDFYGDPTTKCLPSNIIISDLYEDGKLFAYHDMPNEIDLTE